MMSHDLDTLIAKMEAVLSERNERSASPLGGMGSGFFMNFPCISGW